MFKNYLKVTLRNILRNKGYFFITIASLSLGLACCALITLFITDELSYDRFHKKAERIYRIVSSTSEDGVPTNANGSLGVGPALKKDFPEVIEIVRLRKMGQSVKRYVGYKEKKFYEQKFFFAEPSIFTLFDFPLTKGNPDTALRDTNTIVITQEMAKKYFGEEDPLGKTLEADPYNDGKLMLFRITGVAKNVPRNSHFHFDFLASYISLREKTNDFSGFYQHFTYVLLNKSSSAESLNKKLLDFLHRNWKKDPWYTISLQPLLDIRLNSRLRSEIEPTGSILYIYIFTAVAIFVLLIACINFMNLTTARSIKRSKEVGLRKVVGARKKQLVRQFLGESIVLSLCSALVAMLLVLAALPIFNSLAHKGVTLDSVINGRFMVAFITISLGMGVLSGIYPAFILSSFQPIHSLKTRPEFTVSSGTKLRKGLVVFQFALSIGIIFASVIAHGQMKYINSHHLGYDKQQILVIPLNRDLRQNYTAFKDALLQYPGIENATTSSYVPTRGSAHRSLQFQGQDQRLGQVIYLVDKDFVKTYGLRLLAGKDMRLPLSKAGTSEFLISQLTAREAGYTSPQAAVGKSVTFYEYKGYVAGVVNDINLYSLHRDYYSITYMISSIESHNYMSLRISPQNLSASLSNIREIWKKLIPNYPLDCFFLDSSFQEMHAADKNMGEILSAFSILGIFIACLGLFALAAYLVQQKTKEIGIRKILGASVFNIYLLLSWQFVKWVVLANVLTWPVAYFIMRKWLQNFAFRMGISWEAFLFSGCMALIISVMAVSYQSVKAAVTNPIESLRYE
jgi:putative ABC transport system permease protein